MNREGVKFRKSIYATLVFIILIWGIKIVEYTLDFDFGQLGIFPRTLRGSVGILTAPLIHGDIYHLLSNTVPIIFLGVGILYFYEKIAFIVIALIYVMTGFWVWLAARDAYHIGASGLVYGLLAFLLFSGFFRRDTKTLALSFIVLFLYGGSFVSGIVPTDAAISWESHLMGAIAGLFCAVYFKSTKVNVGEHQEEDVEEESKQEMNYNYIYTESSTDIKQNKTTYTMNLPPDNANLSNTSTKE